MAVTGTLGPHASDAPTSTRSRGHGNRSVPLLGGYRRVAQSGVAVAGLAALSMRASAHGGVSDGSTPVSFLVVLGLPTVAGLIGGTVAVRHRRATHSGSHLPSGIGLGLLLVVLGVTFTTTALTKQLSASIIGGAVGVVSAALTTQRGTSSGRGCPGHTHLAFGAVCVHRVLEGIVLGVLYSTGAVVGLVGATVLAGHTALETAAVGGLYAPNRVRAGSAVVLVQMGYLAGATTGVALSGSIPALVRIGLLALGGGVLLVTGVTETRRSLFPAYPHKR